MGFGGIKGEGCMGIINGDVSQYGYMNVHMYTVQ